jgi:hypothetical protein
VLQGPLSVSINPDEPVSRLAGRACAGIRRRYWPATTFKCTGAASESLKTAITNNTTVVLQADFA